MSFFSWLKPDKNPFYLITIAAVFTLSFSAVQQYEECNWNFLYYLVGFIIFINLGLSLVPQEIEDEEYAKNLRFARSIGIATATLSLIFLRGILKEKPSTPILYLVLIEVFVFSLYLFMGILNKSNINYQGRKKINNFQLCLTTSSLLIGIIINYNGPIENSTVATANPKRFLTDSIVSNAMSITSNREIVDTEKIQADSSTNVNPNKSNKVNESKIVKTTVEDCQRSVYKLFLFAWIICMAAWVYQLRGVLNIKFNFGNLPD